MKQLYLDIITLIKAQCPSIRYYGMYNSQDLDIQDGSTYSFMLPAVFIEFVNDNPVDSIGNNVQIYDPMDINFHVLHDHYDQQDGTMEVNLPVFDCEAEIYAAVQLAKFNGSGPLSRVGVPRDYNHNNVYHSISTFRTTFTDTSQALPKAGYEIGPSLLAEITAEKLPLSIAEVSVSTNNIALNAVSVGQPVTSTFTVFGTHLGSELILATGDTQLNVSLDGVNFSTVQMISTNNGVVDQTTITVRFIPVVSGAFASTITYGAFGLNGLIIVTGTGI